MRNLAGDMFTELAFPPLSVLIQPLGISCRKHVRVDAAVLCLGPKYLRSVNDVDAALGQQNRQVKKIPALQALQDASELFTGNLRQRVDREGHMVW